MKDLEKLEVILLLLLSVVFVSGIFIHSWLIKAHTPSQRFGP